MRIVYVMDPMTKVLPDKDTTFALQRAAQARGHQSLHAEVRDVFVLGGASPTGQREVRRAAVFILLKPKAERDIAQKELKVTIAEKLASVPDVRAWYVNERGERETARAHEALEEDAPVTVGTDGSARAEAARLRALEEVVARLREGKHYEIDADGKSAFLTDDGAKLVEEEPHFFCSRSSPTIHSFWLPQCLRASS